MRSPHYQLSLVCTLAPLLILGCPSDDDSGAQTTGTTQAPGSGSEGTADHGDSSGSGGGSDTGSGSGGADDTGTADASDSGSGDRGGSTTGPVVCGSPAELGSFVPTDGDARGMAVSGDTVFLAVTSGGLEAVDITDPAAPSSVGTIDFDAGQLAFTVALADDHAIVGQRGAGWKIVDVSDPAAMVEVASDEDEDAEDVAVDGATMFVIDGTGLRTYDISDPAAPTVLSSTVTLPGASNALALAGTTAYVAASGGGLVAVDVSDPAVPAELSTFETPANATHLAVAGTTVFVSHADGVHAVDMTDPAAPQMLGVYERERAHAVAIADGQLFVLGDDTASTSVPFLALVDIADPAAPTELDATFDLYEDPAAVVVDGDRVLFTVEDDDALHILDPCPAR